MSGLTAIIVEPNCIGAVERGRVDLCPNHDARVKEGEKSSAWFYSIWVTWGPNLPSQLVFTGFEETLPLAKSA